MPVYLSLFVAVLVSLSPIASASDRADFEALCTCSGPPECGGGNVYDSSTDVRASWNVPIDFDAKRQLSKAKAACNIIKSKYCLPNKSLSTSGGKGSVKCTVSNVSYRQIGATPAAEATTARKECTPPEGTAFDAKFWKHIQDTDLPGREVWHGTTAAAEDSVRAGPKNMGEGFGGQGLYLFLTNTNEGAATFAGLSSNKTGSPPVVLRGKIKPDADVCVGGQFMITRSVHNLEEGWLIGDWEKKRPELKSDLDRFDILDLAPHPQPGEGVSIPEGRFLVIHESAGADIIQWEP
jgi:hypothetical protein